ncbi:putative second BRCT domain on Nijmegen syndrome breakage protein [Elsinoe fawcettii]|nr:putative second BRCT domain on Nijmegen syndrome breakage protein [Elsinoe fawcettii]
MWFLSCDGDHLQGKSIWLRPGSKHLFGRTHPGSGSDQFHAITHKSVSRRHFELHVAPVEKGASAKVHKRSTITIKDLGSKAGTHIDNEKIKGDNLEQSFNVGDHVLRLGNYEVPFRIKWVPMVLSFTGIPRRAKQSEDPLAEHRAKVEELDVKCVTEYITNQTSHVVTNKRNNAMALQALVNGRAIVVEEYLDAIQKAAERPSVGPDTLALSSLESDWDLNWPKELDYLPGPAKEPNPRPEHDEIFLPKQPRSEMFHKYVFIFMTETQYQTFLPVITGGGGKALLREVEAPEENPDFDDFLDYVKSCAGKKGDAAFRLSQHPAAKGGVVVVRPGDPTRTAGAQFIQRLDLALDQRSVQQNEFLEAILLTDPTELRRPLEVDLVREDEEDRPDTGRSNTAAPSAPEDRPPTPPPQSSAPARKRRNFTRQKITTFDDFDPSQIQRSSAVPTRDSPPAPSQSQRSSADIDPAPPQTATQSRKRHADAPLRPVETTGQVLDSLFTGAAAAKRRRLDTSTNGEKRPASDALESEEETTRTDTKGRKKRKSNGKEKDVMAQVKAKREEEDKRRQAEEEALKLAMEGVDHHAVRQGLVIEDMPVRARLESVAAEGQWRDEWNGRANWKRFKKRRPGEAGDEDGPVQRRVIVGLEVFKEGSLEMDWGSRVGRYSQGNGNSHRGREAGEEGNGMRRRRRGVLADPDDEPNEDTELRERIERSRIDDEREQAEREDDVLDMGNARDPEIRRRQQEAKQREQQKKQDRLSQLTSHAPSQASERPSLLSELREMDKDKGKAGEKVRKRPREQVEEEDEGGTRFRRRRRG